MNAISFNAETFANAQRVAGNAWRNAEGKADGFARSALAALVTGSLSPLALAISVYDEMKPLTAKGKLAEPKEAKNGSVSISSLRSAKGGEGARSCLEALFYIHDNIDVDSDAVSAFILDAKGAFRLFPLKKHIQRMKAEAAKEQAAATVPEAGDEREDDETTVTETVASPLTVALDYIASLTGDALTAEADAIEALLTACRDASDRMAAAEALAEAA